MSFHVFMSLLSYVFGLLKTIKEFLLLLLLHHCIPLAPVGSFSSAPPWILGIRLARWLSVSASGSSTTCSAAVGRPPGVGGHPSSMAPLSIGSTMGHHHDCGQGPAVLLLLWVPPGSSLIRHPPCLCLPAPSRVSVLLQSHLPSSHPPLLMLFPQCEDAPSGRGRCVRIMDLSVCAFAPCYPVSPSCSRFKVLFFITYSIIQDIISSEMSIRSGPLNEQYKKIKHNTREYI